MKYALLAILSFVLCASCASSEPLLPDQELEGPTVTEIAALSGNRRALEAAADDEYADQMTDSDFVEGSLLYISQMGSSSANNPNFTVGASDNLYIYSYEENPDASWDAEGTYNFYPTTLTKAIEWEDVRGRGSVGNAFSLYALHFPVDNAVRFDVETDQRELEDFKKSDILGAYHATSALYTRLRFRLYHLMVYLRVTLYVPVYEVQFDEKTNEYLYSGFREDAFEHAQMRKATTGFNIDWRVNRSSDTDAPLTVLNTAAGYTNQTIQMYRHDAGQTPEQTEITLGDFYDYPEGDEFASTTDKVYVYNFSVLFPGQVFGNEFLHFQFRTPGGTYKNYTFSASQLKTGATDFGFTQGTLQHLSLYLPRKGNETILVGARILDWTDASTDMTVTDQTSSGGNGSDDDPKSDGGDPDNRN